jgi:hypothetical protein
MVVGAMVVVGGGKRLKVVLEEVTNSWGEGEWRIR